MKIRIVGLNCSPRTESNSAAVLDEAARRANEKLGGEIDFERVNLRDCDFEPCRACGVCGKRKDRDEFMSCVQHDDLDAVMAKLVAADGIVVATPVYFGLPSDLFSKFIMRTRYLRHQDFKLANKAVAVMAIAGRRSGGAETTIVSTWLPFIRHGCLIVGNGDQTCQFGTMGWAGPSGQILTDEWGMEQAEQTMRRVYEIASLVKAGSTAINHQCPMRFSYQAGTR
jgi:multimeric flavodoxin WrbA